MSQFYTHVSKYGNSLLVRGYNEGVQFKKKVQFEPTLYVTDKTNSESKFKTLQNKPIKPITFENMNEAKLFMEKYDDVSGFNVYGNPAWQYQYLSDIYTKDILYDVSKVRTHTLDIETTVGGQFKYDLSTKIKIRKK